MKLDENTGHGPDSGHGKPDDAGQNHTVTIVVDGTPYDVPKKEYISYAEVVALAYPDYAQSPGVTYSVTYTGGHGNKPEGILSPGGRVKVKEGMAFRVNRTGQS